MIAAEELLKPISDEHPCGEDLYYDPSFQELATLVKGKPETQFSAAEDPDWKALHERCLELFARSKDLRVATALCLAVVKVEGLASLQEGLALLKGLIERYWEPVYPRLDPDDNNDPLYRVNIIAALSTPKGTFGDPMRFLERLRDTPLSNSVQMGRFSLADVSKAQAGAADTAAENKPAVTQAQVEAAFRDTKPEHLQQINQAVSGSLTLVKEIDAVLTSTIGAGKAPNLELLEGELKEIQRCLVPYLPAGSVVEVEEVAPDGGRVGNAPTSSKPISGEIQSRQDVAKLLDKICQYYTRTEPSSPVPFLLRRAQRWAEMDFMQIIGDVSPDAMPQVRVVTGEKEE